MFFFHGQIFEEVHRGHRVRFFVKVLRSCRKLTLASLGRNEFELRIPAFTEATSTDVLMFISEEADWMAGIIEDEQKKIREHAAELLHHGEAFEGVVDGQAVRFTVKARANRRQLTLKNLGGSEFEVRIPARSPVTRSEVQDFIARQSAWIAERVRRTMLIRDGESFEEAIEGQTVRFTVKAQASRRRIVLASLGGSAFEVRIPASRPVTRSEVQEFIAEATDWIAGIVEASPKKPSAILRHDETFEEVIDGRTVRFTVKEHAGRRRIGLVSVEGAFEVRIPARSRVTLAEAQKLIDEQTAWIAERIEAYERRTPEKTARLSDGGSVQLFGVWTTLELGGALALRSALFHPGEEGSRLRLPVPPGSPPMTIGTFLLMKATFELRAFITRVLEELKEIHRASVGKIDIVKTRSRWGTCDAEGNMTFTIWLVCLPPWAIRLVVAHEYTHRFEMNHGPRFHETLERFVPGHRALQKKMNELYKIRELPKLLGLYPGSSD